MKKSKKGFTLIELLVVVLIIGILASIAVPQYQKAVYKSRLANLKLIANSIYKAQEAHFLSTGTYTINPQELDLSLPQPNEIIEGDSQYEYIYDWGKCLIHSATIACYYNSVLKYGFYYSSTTFARKNKAECCSSEGSEIAKEVCKNDTNQTSPFFENEAGTYACYSYN